MVVWQRHLGECLSFLTELPCVADAGHNTLWPQLHKNPVHLLNISQVGLRFLLSTEESFSIQQAVHLASQCLGAPVGAGVARKLARDLTLNSMGSEALWTWVDI
jgi:hypothetical protein